MSGNILIHLEEEYLPALLKHVEKELATAFPKAAQRKGLKLRSPSVRVDLEGEEARAEVPDGENARRVRFAFPIFDQHGGYSSAQCDCSEGRPSLDEERCAHMWVTLSLLGEALRVRVHPSSTEHEVVATLENFLGAMASQPRDMIQHALQRRANVQFRLEDSGEIMPLVTDGRGGFKSMTWESFRSQPALWDGRPWQRLLARFDSQGRGADSFGMLWDLFELGESVRVGQASFAVAQGTLLLRLGKSTKGWAVTPFFMESPDVSLEVFQGSGLMGRAAERLLLCRADLPTCQLVTKLLQDPPVPLGESRALFEILARVQSRLPVVAGNVALRERLWEAPRLHVRLEPLPPEGLAITVQIKMSALGPYLPPGEGPQRVVDLLAEESALLCRDLASERRMLERFEKGTALGMPYRPGLYALESQDDALGFLTALGQPDLAGCLVVEWPKERPTRLNVQEADPEQVTVKVRKGENWFGLEGGLTLPEGVVPFKALWEAMAVGRRFIPLESGGWLALTRDVEERLRRLHALSLPTRDGFRMNPAGAEALVELSKEAAFPVHDTQGAWAAFSATVEARERTPEASLPAGLQATLRSYQEEGFRWLMRHARAGQGAILADDMGLGKTVQTIACLLARAEEALSPSLIIAPTSVMGNWKREIERFAPALKPHLFHDRRSLENLGGGDVVLVSYGLALREEERFLAAPWAHIVFDEAQALKNNASRSAQFARRLVGGWKLALSGTPVENRLADLWSLVGVVAPGWLPSWEIFREEFVTPMEAGTGSAVGVRLHEQVRPLILRRLKIDHLHELPPKTEKTLLVELSAQETVLYEAARREALAVLRAREAQDDDDSQFQVLAALTRLRQLACHPALVLPDYKGSSAKTEETLERCVSLKEAGHHVLLFSQFTRFLQILRDRLEAEGLRCLILEGATPLKERARRVDAFQNGEADVFLISLKAGGSGLNLTGADYVLHVDPWWNPKASDQATDRAHRMGQKRPVTVYRMLARGTLEEKIARLHEKKRALFTEVIDGAPGAILTAREWMGLLEDEVSTGDETVTDSSTPTLPATIDNPSQIEGV